LNFFLFLFNFSYYLLPKTYYQLPSQNLLSQGVLSLLPR